MGVGSGMGLHSLSLCHGAFPQLPLLLPHQFSISPPISTLYLATSG